MYCLFESCDRDSKRTGIEERTLDYQSKLASPQWEKVFGRKAGVLAGV